MMLKDRIEDHEAISSDRVDGTAVYGSDGDKIGSVKRVMIEKRSGQVRDVEISVGGFLGMGSEIHSMPWEKFDYDTDCGGYKLDVTEDQLKEAPTYEASDDDDRFYDPQHRSTVYEYWQVSPYW